MLCVGRAIEIRKEVFTEWKMLNLVRHTLPCWMAECLGSSEPEEFAQWTGLGGEKC